MHEEDGRRPVRAHIVRRQLVLQRCDRAVVRAHAEHAEDPSAVLQRIAHHRVPRPHLDRRAVIRRTRKNVLELRIRIAARQPRWNISAALCAQCPIRRCTRHAHHVACRIDARVKDHRLARGRTDRAQRSSAGSRNRLPAAQRERRRAHHRRLMRLLVHRIPAVGAALVDAALLVQQQLRRLHIRVQSLHHVAVGHDGGVVPMHGGAHSAVGHEVRELLTHQPRRGPRTEPDEPAKDDGDDQRRNKRQASDLLPQRHPVRHIGAHRGPTRRFRLVSWYIRVPAMRRKMPCVRQNTGIQA